MNPLVSGDWLAAHLDDVVVVDVRPGYADGHVPGARHLSLDGDLADPATPGDGRHPLPTPERFAAIDEVREAAVLLDARAAGRFTGDAPDPALDPRPGHIPGARSAPWHDNLDPATGLFRSPEELRARYEALGVGGTTDVVAYCGSGVTACHDLLALEVAGVGSTRLYVGSWSQWGSDRSRPAALGPDGEERIAGV